MASEERITPETGETISLATDIVTAYVSNNTVPAQELPLLIKSVQQALVEAASSGG
jgi:predicted transcriptional regulator